MGLLVTMWFFLLVPLRWCLFLPVSVIFLPVPVRYLLLPVSVIFLPVPVRYQLLPVCGFFLVGQC